MRMIALAAAFAVAGIVAPGWADDAKKEVLKDGAKTTKLVIKDMT